MLSTCSEYFEEMFERTQDKHPVIVLKDIKCDDLEALLNYMYVGEVNVVQEKLAGLIKAAECLKIKGLAVPDEDPIESSGGKREINSNKRSQRSEDNSPRAKRRRRENSASDNVSDEVVVNNTHRSRQSNRSRDSLSSQQPKSSNISSHLEPSDSSDHRDPENASQDRLEDGENSSSHSSRHQGDASRLTNSSHKKEHVPEEVSLLLFHLVTRSDI